VWLKLYLTFKNWKGGCYHCLGKTFNLVAFHVPNTELRQFLTLQFLASLPPGTKVISPIQHLRATFFPVIKYHTYFPEFLAVRYHGQYHSIARGGKHSSSRDRQPVTQPPIFKPTDIEGQLLARDPFKDNPRPQDIAEIDNAEELVHIS
jgi:hypothetical protein